LHLVGDLFELYDDARTYKSYIPLMCIPGNGYGSGQSAARSSLNKVQSYPLKRGLGTFSRRSGHVGEEVSLLSYIGGINHVSLDFWSVA